MTILPNFVKKDVDKYKDMIIAQHKNFVKQAPKVEAKSTAKQAVKPKGE